MTPQRLRMLFLGGCCALSTAVVWTSANPVPHAGGDNAGYIALAHDLLTNGTYNDAFDPEGLPHTKYPPVFPALLALLMAMGARSWVAFKSVAGVATVAAVAFSYLWAERVLRPAGAFAVGLVMALAAGVVYYSQWVLSDPVFLALTTLALFALAKADGTPREVGATPGKVDATPGKAGATPGTADATPDGTASTGADASIQVPWLALGVVAAGLAYFTRSAGLPLVLAVVGWLALRRAWRSLAVTSVALGVPMVAWWLRARSVQGVAQYSSEFWMVNPYDPSLGTVGFGGLVGRVVENAAGYTTAHLPVGIVGSGAPAPGLIGTLLVGAALVGWLVRTRDTLGPAELFFPLYWGVILLWPTVWSGDRFALPLLPLVFVYGAVAFGLLARRVPEAAAPVVGTVLVLALLLPAAEAWRGAVTASSACPEDVRRDDVWACYGPGVQNFMAAAAWSGHALPDGAAVLTRKPRHFYLQSGLPSRAFAFFEEPDPHLDLADALGARYVLLDQWDGLARRYVASAVTRRPGAFCFVRGFGSAAGGGSQLLGVLPPERRDATRGGGADVRLEGCDASYTSEQAATAGDYSSSGRMPLLEGLDS